MTLGYGYGSESESIPFSSASSVQLLFLIDQKIKTTRVTQKEENYQRLS